MEFSYYGNTKKKIIIIKNRIYNFKVKLIKKNKLIENQQDSLKNISY